jgi:EAL domain-containing protein (putative c-di-GMP-specific phosphodiesterase class I)/GGDEF domain-containing protein
MLLPEIKEREYRFRLALRIGLPIFALVFALVSHTLITTYTSLQPSFYVESILLLGFSIYFIFYIIYSGFNVKIRDDVSGTFTREYIYKYLRKELKENDEYTLILMSIDNLHDINKLYGIKNGDKVLGEVSKHIGNYLKNEKIENFPIGHLKGGDFILGLKDAKEHYATILELLCLKSSELKIDDIEVKISGTITDSNYSHDLNFLIENLFELQEKKKQSKYKEENIDPNKLESFVINAIKGRDFLINSQDVFSEEECQFSECFIKLKREDGKFIYPKGYVKVIKKLGLWIDFDLMVLEEITEKLSNMETQVYALNISPTSLRNEKFLSSVTAIFKANPALGKKIIFILAEQEYYSFTSRYNAILKVLRSLGIRIVIDRVGSLHTSFLYLRELDIDMVRFDTYYSSGSKMLENRSIIDGFKLMAKEKGIKTWMKNLEDEASSALAKEMKIDFIQGKYLAQLENF